MHRLRRRCAYSESCQEEAPFPAFSEMRWLGIDPEHSLDQETGFTVMCEEGGTVRSPLLGWRLWVLAVGGALEVTGLHLGSVLRTWGSVSGLSRSLTKWHYLFWVFDTYFLDLNKIESKCTYQARFSSVAQSCSTLCDPMDCSTPGLPGHHQLPEFTQLMSIELVMPSNHLILCRPLLLLPAIFPSIRVFLNESVLHIRWPKYWSFSLSISPSSEHPGLISFRMDWLDLLAVQGTLKSLLQHHSSKSSILRCSDFFVVQLSHPYTTTGKTNDPT